MTTYSGSKKKERNELTFNCSYLQYATICARAVRNSLKDETRTLALRRNQNNLKFAKWESGVQKDTVSIQ